MRLINIHTLQLQDFIDDIPPYAILSHTWGSDEVTFGDFKDSTKREGQAGFRKIQLTCKQAYNAGLNWAWVDTCCINKSSSAELSEAINSMFKWYRNSDVCYAYLEDWPDDKRDSELPLAKALSQCRWFSRGFTLQELIAPENIEFYVCDGEQWRSIGSKKDLLTDLSLVTRVSWNILLGGELSFISVAERMSWAAGRRTHREEDIAYCLMGIFNVNMPLLYGEGQKAFVRLQEEILKDSEDHSLFAWRASPESAVRFPYRGLFAESPDEFLGTENIIPFKSLTSNTTLMSITNRGIPLTSVTDILETDRVRKWNAEHVIRVGLNCRWANDFTKVVAIELTSHGGDQYVRSDSLNLLEIPSLGLVRTFYVTKSLRTRLLPLNLTPGRQNAIHINIVTPSLQFIAAYGNGLNFSTELGLIEMGPWVQDKAGIEIVIPDAKKRILILIWAKYGASTGTWEYSINGIATTPENIAAKFAEAKQPKSQQVSRNIFYDQYNSVHASGHLGKVQGFDMFCVRLQGCQQARRFYRLGNFEVILHSPRRFFAYVQDAFLR
ncbi:HET-domain-containing protein [Xylariaceae sp. FL1651]|nr:HET-domain-containing protein [Xylariaceae sp. FL1651]